MIESIESDEKYVTNHSHTCTDVLYIESAVWWRSVFDIGFDIDRTLPNHRDTPSNEPLMNESALYWFVSILMEIFMSLRLDEDYNIFAQTI